MSKNSIIVTRPTLASQLMDAGIAGEIVSNPWKPNLSAWLFPINDQSREIITAYYREIGKPVPLSVKER